MELSNLNIKNGLCISLGANIDSNYGKPIESLIICKPKIENLIKNWINQSKSFEKEIESSKAIFYWSSIYETSPHGRQTRWIYRCLCFIEYRRASFSARSFSRGS